MLLAALTIVYLATSWRRWPDAVVDFGRELYIPWRLAEGALLYRDVDDFYGPLSQYVNAGLFSLFGPGMMVLVAANLLVFAGVLGGTYVLVRRAWGAGAAFLGAAVFVAVFGFARYLHVGNFNYATPYAHETTHGMLVLIALAGALVKWLERPGAFGAALIGLLFGLTLVLKPEIIFAAAASIAATCVLRWRRRSEQPLQLREWVAGVVAAAAPTLAFWIFFSRHVGAAEGFTSAGRAWLSVIGTSRYIGDPVQVKYTGFDAPGRNLLEHFVAIGVVAALMVALVAGGAGSIGAGAARQRFLWGRQG